MYTSASEQKSETPSRMFFLHPQACFHGGAIRDSQGDAQGEAPSGVVHDSRRIGWRGAYVAGGSATAHWRLGGNSDHLPEPIRAKEPDPLVSIIRVLLLGHSAILPQRLFQDFGGEFLKAISKRREDKEQKQACLGQPFEEEDEITYLTIPIPCLVPDRCLFRRLFPGLKWHAKSQIKSKLETTEVVSYAQAGSSRRV